MRKLLMALGLFLALLSNCFAESHFNENLEVIEIGFSRYSNDFEFIKDFEADFLIRDHLRNQIFGESLYIINVKNSDLEFVLDVLKKKYYFFYKNTIKPRVLNKAEKKYFKRNEEEYKFFFNSNKKTNKEVIKWDITIQNELTQV